MAEDGRAFAEALLEHADAALVAVDEHLEVRWMSPAAFALFGTRYGPLPDLVSVDDAPAVAAFLASVTPGGVSAARLACSVPVPGSSPRTLELIVRDLREVEAIEMVIVAVADVTRWAEREAALQTATQQDDLTGVGNRRAVEGALNQAVRSAPTSEPGPALLTVDIDHFKQINDMFGHAAGDMALQLVAAHLASVVGTRGTVARTGGDEFAVLADRVTAAEAGALGEAIAQSMLAPLDMFSDTSLSVSLGVALLVGTPSARSAMLQADKALYRAKQLGRGRSVIYGPELDDWSQTRKQDLERLAAKVQDLEAQNEALAEAVTVDARTSLPNGAPFDADHAALHARFSRDGEPYALALIDIDNFHAYNTRYRYLAGHEALARVARKIANTVRRADRSYRYGGEEFTVLLPGVCLEEAAALAERIRSEIEAMAIEHLDGPAGVVTVSIGVVSASPAYATPEEAVEAANMLLQQAKDSGRNCVIGPVT